MFRKRYTVVIIGGAGSSAAQRSEISRHRSERDAMLAAQYERERLGGLHGDGTGKYRVVVEREGEVISTGPVADLSGLPTEITHGHPDDAFDLQLGDSPTDPGRQHPIIRTAPEPPAAAETAAPDRAVPTSDSASVAIPGAPMPLEPSAGAAGDEIPEGPVPEDILRRFEEAIEREQERRSSKLPPGE
jgi:hypothetical protein